MEARLAGQPGHISTSHRTAAAPYRTVTLAPSTAKACASTRQRHQLRTIVETTDVATHVREASVSLWSRADAPRMETMFQTLPVGDRAQH